MGVAEHLLAAPYGVMAGHDVLARGQVVEVDEPVLEPATVRMLAGQLGFELAVFDDASLARIHQEHAAWLQAALLDYAARRDWNHACLASYDHAIVVGDPVAARA